MDIVVDTSAIVAVVANDPQKEALVRKTYGATLIAPHSVHWEIGNAFSGLLKRQRITFDQARRGINAYREIPIRFVDVDLIESLKLAYEVNIYLYDAHLLVCARSHRCPLLTMDGDLVDAAGKTGVEVLEVEE